MYELDYTQDPISVPTTRESEQVDSFLSACQNLPFSQAELLQARQRAQLQTLEKLIRLAYWENFPYPTSSFGTNKNIKNLALWLSRTIVSWTVRGDENDLLAKLDFEDPQLNSIHYWLTLWAAEGVDESALTRFQQELVNSIDNEAVAICFRDRWNRELQQAIGHQPFWQGLKHSQQFRQNPALFLEQWGAIGHPIHPTIKAKLGVSTEDVFLTAPEFKGQACLAIAAIKRDHSVLEGGTVDAYLTMFQQHFPQQFEQWQASLGDDAQYHLPLPVHPIQLEDRWQSGLETGLHIAEQPPRIDSFASLSYRTVYPRGGASKPFIKLPVGMRLTSTQRTVSPRSCQMGPRVSNLLLEICTRDSTIDNAFTPLPEMWGLHLNASSEIAKHFSVIFRAPLSEVLAPNELAIPVAALVAKTPDDKHLISHILTRDTHNVSLLMKNFQQYVQHLLQAALGLYLKFGVTLEAHQQNSFLKINQDDQILGFVIRDFGGVRIHPESLEEKGLSLVFHEDPLILAQQRSQCRQKLIHTLYVCHIGALVSALSADFELPSSWLWRTVATETQDVFSSSKSAMSSTNYVEDRQALLYAPWETKAFITMRLQEASGDLWTQINNPLKPWT